VRTLSRRETLLLALVAVAAAVLLYQRLHDPAGQPAARTRAEPLPPPIPRIGLDRVAAERKDSGAGKRDLFRFGSAARGRDDEEPPPVASVPAYAQPPVTADSDLAAQPSLPPLNLKYLGAVESKTGIKVAVLLTDRREVLTGQAGETVANRYRISRIGLESVDLEDVTSGQARRLPLRGN